MKYAIIRLQGQQHKVSEKDEILVDKINGQPKADVLMVVDGEKVKIGKPTVRGAKITFKVLGEEKGKKLHVATFKAKSRYRRKVGFRPQYTKLLVQTISY